MNVDFWKYLDSRLLLTIKRAYDYHRLLGEYYELLYNTGLRGREATNKERWLEIDYIKNTIKFQPAKKSYIRTFKLSCIPKITYRNIINKAEENQETKYRQATDHFNKFFQCKQILVNTKKTTLHIFRHNYIKKLVIAGKKKEEIKKIIGHNDIRKTVHYIQEERILIEENP
ncbi:MAG: tyrosine-type recombinase/integrase [Marinisporobacter sp.]|nr:tyrosine-type recombinase/integrase [Marinisporobacter sp.]